MACRRCFRAGALFLVAALLGASTPPAGGIEILDPVGTDGAEALSSRFRDALRAGVRAWEIGAGAAQKVRFRLATRLQASSQRLHLVVKLLPEYGEATLFARTYFATRSGVDWLVGKVLDDLAKHFTGKEAGASRYLLGVRPTGAGVSEIVLMDAAGTRVVELTQHRSRTLAPTEVRHGRFAYVTYVAGPPQVWGMELKRRAPTRLFVPEAGAGTVTSPALSPDGRTLAFVETDRIGRRAIRLLDWDSRASRLLTAFADDLASPAWCPDGRKVAAITGPPGKNTLVILSLDGRVETSVSLPGRIVGEPAWSPDGQRLCLAARVPGGEDHALLIVTPASRTTETLLRSGDALESPRWNPSGSHVAYVSAAQGICLISLETRKSRPVAPFARTCRTPRWVW